MYYTREKLTGSMDSLKLDLTAKERAAFLKSAATGYFAGISPVPER